MNQFPHSVRDEYAMECPGCGSDQDIVVYATQAIWVKLVSDGTQEFGDAYDTEWEDHSKARCTDCGYEGEVEDFHIVTEEVKERKLENEWRYAVQCCDTFMGFEDWKEDQVKVSAHPEPESGANSHSGDLEGVLSELTEGKSLSEALADNNPIRHKSDIIRQVCEEMGIKTLVHSPVEVSDSGFEGYPELKQEALHKLKEFFPEEHYRITMKELPGVPDDTCKAGTFPLGWANTDFDYPNIPLLMNNILWHLESCAEKPDGGGAAYMAKELAKLIGRKE